MESSAEIPQRKNSENGKVRFHPSLYLPEYRRYIFWLVASSLIQFLWAGTVFYYSIKPPSFLRADANPYFNPGAVYSFYSCLHAGYILICVLMGTFLVSRGWIRAAAAGSMVPGLGFLFGLFQIIPGWIIFRSLGKKHWESFFHWRDRSSVINRLTS